MLTINIIRKDRLDSTNSSMSDLLTACPNIAEGTVIVAKEQTGGRGQRGNKWESEAGKNLTFSILLRPSFLAIKEHFYLSMVVSLSVLRTLQEIGVEGVSVKWPNDVYIGERKVCGILIENIICGSEIETSIVGIGINVNQKEFKSDAPNPVSLITVRGRGFDLDVCLDIFLRKFGELYDLLRDSEHGIIRDEYLGSLFRYNKTAIYRDAKTMKEFSGTICDVGDDGGLIIKEEDSGETRCYYFKEVEFVI